MKATDVTVEMGLEAYDKTGLKPRAGGVYFKQVEYMGKGPPVQCGCLVGAIALAQGMELADDAETSSVLERLFDGFEDSGDETVDQPEWDLAMGFDTGYSDPKIDLDAHFPSEVFTKAGQQCYRVGFEVGKEMRMRSDREENETKTDDS